MMQRKHGESTDRAAARMSCRQFERDLGDWAAGRLPADAAARMEGHRAACATCARAFEEERALRSLFSAAAESGPAAAGARTPELWDRVAARIATPPAPVRPARLSWVEALRASRAPSRAYAFGGAVACAAALGVIVWMHGSAPPGPANVARIGSGTGPVASAPVDETHVLQLVSEMQSMPDPDSEYTLAATGVPRREARTILFGGAPTQARQAQPAQQPENDSAAVTEP